MGLPETKYITETEYLATERLANFKSEYYKGEVFAMSGASKPHNEIAVNCLVSLKNKLKGKSCRPYGSDFRVYIPENTLYTYPDISVFCKDPITTDNEDDTAKNPTIIIEILSKSTRNYDLGEKFLLYRAIPSLKEYILIDSEALKVIQNTKDDKASWLMTEFNAITDVIEIKAIDVVLNLCDIYEDVVFLNH